MALGHILTTFRQTRELLVDVLVKRTEGINLSMDRLALHRLREAIEKAKIGLSSTSQTEIKQPFITTDAFGAKHVNVTLTKSKFESLVNHLIKRLIGSL